jgi:hypothetical protein
MKNSYNFASDDLEYQNSNINGNKIKKRAADRFQLDDENSYNFASDDLEYQNSNIRQNMTVDGLEITGNQHGLAHFNQRNNGIEKTLPL